MDATDNRPDNKANTCTLTCYTHVLDVTTLTAMHDLTIPTRYCR